MSKNKSTLSYSLPILPGSISTAMAKCGNKNCRCAAKKDPQLHGPYFRWTGFINGKRTTVTITEEEAKECERRIANYKKLLANFNKIVEEGVSVAPWTTRE